jgi:hypothetical protein
MTSSVKLACVDPAMIEKVWPLARPFIKRAIEIHGLDDFEHNEPSALARSQRDHY